MNPGHHVWKSEYLVTFFLHRIYHFHLSGNYSRSIFLLLHVTLKWVALSIYTYRFYQTFESCWWLTVNASSSLFSDVHTGALSLFAQPYPVVTLGETGTLYCNSGSTYDLFTLSKQHGDGDFVNCIKQSYNRFHISPVTAAHSGIYRCMARTRLSPINGKAPVNHWSS